MKSLKKLFLFIIIICQFSWSQEDKKFEVIYNKAFKKTSDTTNSAPKLVKNLDYKLIFNNSKAEFKYITSMDSDNNKINKRLIKLGGGAGLYYKDLNSKEKLWQTDFIDVVYLVKDYQYNWKLLNEKKSILGHDCFKAKAIFKDYNYMLKEEITKEIIVWYTPTIPVPFGPSGYDGLPGLVLEAQNESFYFIANQINPLKKSIKIEKPKEGKKVTFVEFNKEIFNQGRALLMRREKEMSKEKN